MKREKMLDKMTRLNQAQWEELKDEMLPEYVITKHDLKWKIVEFDEDSFAIARWNGESWDVAGDFPQFGIALRQVELKLQ